MSKETAIVPLCVLLKPASMQNTLCIPYLWGNYSVKSRVKTRTGSSDQCLELLINVICE